MKMKKEINEIRREGKGFLKILNKKLELYPPMLYVESTDSEVTMAFATSRGVEKLGEYFHDPVGKFHWINVYVWPEKKRSINFYKRVLRHEICEMVEVSIFKLKPSRHSKTENYLAHRNDKCFRNLMDGLRRYYPDNPKGFANYCGRKKTREDRKEFKGE